MAQIDIVIFEATGRTDLARRDSASALLRGVDDAYRQAAKPPSELELLTNVAGELISDIC